jgi:diguanylate cyclase (GGDEF)-like protein
LILLESPSVDKQLDQNQLEDYVEALRSVTMQEVDAISQRLVKDRGTPSLLVPECELPDAEQTDPRLAAVAEALEQLDRANTVAETLGITSETIIRNFDIKGMAVALCHSTGDHYQVCGFWGLPDDLGPIPADAIAPFFSRGKIKKTFYPDAKMRALLPALERGACTLFPLESQGERLGFFAIIDTTLLKAEIMLISMVTQSAAVRLSRILKDAEQSRVSEMSLRLMSLANTLSMVDNLEELQQMILAVSTDLVDAAQGSLMLVDKSGTSMKIVASCGLPFEVARSLSIQIGTGIAGKVAETGEPLVVEDVEKDPRISIINRPRFKTKSLAAVPLRLKEKIIGVLCLSDRNSLQPFTTADLEVLSSFANLAALMIERSAVLEDSVRFEQLSVTDSLTGLYNRRFLKSRLEEELNRSIHQGLNLSLLFIDLDFFKKYNDICGHLAGDEALKRTADIIRGSVREMDIVARYGGEEFCAVLPGTAKQEALLVAERIRVQIENELFPGKSDSRSRVMTASLGVATFPEDGRSFTDLVDASDIALYQAKANGRNCTVAAIGTGQAPAEPLPV